LQIVVTSKTVNELMLGARSRESSLGAFSAKILKTPWCVGSLVSRIDGTGRSLVAGDMEVAFGRGRPGDLLEVAERFERRGSWSGHFDSECI
jgi:hypothetical protein